MKTIRDPKTVEGYKEKLKIREIFSDTSLPFYVTQYESGELLSAPREVLGHPQELLLLIRGTCKVYGLNEDARYIPINLMEQGMLIGDMEYISGGNSLFSEAVTPVTCLALSIEENRQALDKDARFLKYLASGLARKVYLGQAGEDAGMKVEERLLSYMKNECPDSTLKGVEIAAVKVRCSRRQLQRALKKLQEENIIEKCGKGQYRCTSLAAGTYQY